MNDNINLNGSLVLSHNRLVCKTSCTYSKTDVCDKWSSHVGNSPDCTTVHVSAIRRGSCVARVESQAFLDANVGYIHCTNNQYNSKNDISLSIHNHYCTRMKFCKQLVVIVTYFGRSAIISANV